MGSPYVYDKAKYHLESIQKEKLPEEHASNHTAVFLRWLIENNLMNPQFIEESQAPIEEFRSRKLGIHEVYEWCDCCLLDDMLSDEGNRFAMNYFDFENGSYLQDYCDTLEGEYSSTFQIPYNEANYQKMKPVMDRAYGNWKSNKQ